MECKNQMYDKAGKALVKALKNRHFDAYYCKTKDEALKTALNIIPTCDSVSWGGSITIEQIGLKEALKERGTKTIDRDDAKTPTERDEIMRMAFSCGTYIMSANAISSDGQLLNIDGNGNRVAALIYGPKSVVVIAGMNKVCPDAESALIRARNTAAPMNSQRFSSDSRPCYLTGKCTDCLGEDSICAQIVCTRICKPSGRIKIILVGEDLGM